MQVQIKKQLKIELDENDIVEAVGAYLQLNGANVSKEDLVKINFVKSPKDGLRASLNVTEDETIEEEPRTSAPVVEVAEPAPVTVEETETEEDEEPGVIAASTIDDVMPSVEEMKQIVEPEEEEAVAPEPARKALFL